MECDIRIPARGRADLFIYILSAASSQTILIIYVCICNGRIEAMMKRPLDVMKEEEKEKYDRNEVKHGGETNVGDDPTESGGPHGLQLSARL